MDIYLRPLVYEDAMVSYKWRNNPKIWEFTGKRPDKIITYDIEAVWIEEVLKRDNEKRFAICIKENNEYIGNVQLTNISNSDAEFHIFIGEEKYWGKGIASEATRQILHIAKADLNLNEIYLFVNKKNVNAISVYLKNGFIIVDDKTEMIKMICKI